MSHGAAQFLADLARMAFMERAGWTVVRFGNDAVMAGLDGVVEGIWGVLNGAPSDSPPL